MRGNATSVPAGVIAAIAWAVMLGVAAAPSANASRRQAVTAAPPGPQAALRAVESQSLSGYVRFNGQPVPGATVTATNGTRTITAVTDETGAYTLADLSPGVWTLRISMTGFAPAEQHVTVASNAQTPPAEWSLELLPYQGPPPRPGESNITAFSQTTTSGPPGSEKEAENQPPAGTAAGLSGELMNGDLNRTPAAAFTVNGSVNNGAAEPYFQLPAFGNNRRGQNSLYNGALGGIFDNSALDASPFSLTGQKAAKPAYNRITGLAQFGGPLIVPHISNASNAPFIFAAYQMVRSRDDSNTTGLVPTGAERGGDLSQFPGPIVDPSTGKPFPGNRIPKGDISPQATALLRLYPLPNTANGQFNYQVPTVSITHQDSFQTRINKQMSHNQVAGAFAFESSRVSAPNLFAFLDTTDTLGLNTSVSWRHGFSPHFFGTLALQYSRLRLRQMPFFAGRENISGMAGIAGNDQAPADWGPPSLGFASGLAELSDLPPANDRNQTGAVSYSTYWNHGDHNFSFGGDFRRLEFNYLQQQNPRGGFTFNGMATGNDLADFLLGIPDTATIAFGNADKYFRESSYDGFAQDDFHVNSGLTLNAGLRWEYSSPMTELYGRLVNLDIAPQFKAVAPVLASNPHGSLTGAAYPPSLVGGDWTGFEPRIGLAWQPFAAASMIVRAGYGVYYDTSVYQAIASEMSQQAPLSRSLNVANSKATPLTLATAFSASGAGTPDLFAVDPHYRIGYVQTWNASVQQDLPGALLLLVNYLGNKGTHAAQQYLPNTYPAGAANPCPSCPSGFTFLTSGGDSTYEAASVQLERRLAAGFAANAQYTYGNAMDDGILGGRGQTTTPFIAQNWRDLDAERGLSSFDQRHQFTLTTQYTTGMGARSGALLRGWQGAAIRGWTLLTQWTAASGMPLTPETFAIVPGSGVTQTVRPSVTGLSPYAAPPGLFLNPAAYKLPAAGRWGDAGRNSIIGPRQFNLDAALQRSFQVSDRVAASLRVDASNALNHVVFPSWDTLFGSAQFGLPLTAKPMRSLQTTVRFTF
jgi:hypothetical protein